MVTRHGIFPPVKTLCPTYGLTAHFFLGETKPFIRNVFTLNTYLLLEGPQMLSYENESDMLMAWKEFIIKVDPDVITGYNMARFDIPYLLMRAKT
jgi:DNA polymerase delta subunit 1